MESSIAVFLSRHFCLRANANIAKSQLRAPPGASRLRRQECKTNNMEARNIGEQKGIYVGLAKSVTHAASSHCHCAAYGLIIGTLVT